MHCKKCGLENSETNPNCIGCGEPLSPEGERRSSVGPVLVIAIVVLALVNLLIFKVLLSHGTKVVLSVSPEAGEEWPAAAEARSNEMDRIIYILKERVASMGLDKSGFEIGNKDGKNTEIEIKFRGTVDRDSVERLLSAKGRLEFRHFRNVKYEYDKEDKKYVMSVDIDPDTEKQVITFYDKADNPVELKEIIEDSPVILTGKDVSSASAVDSPISSRSNISLNFDSTGKEVFADFTRENIGECLAIILDGEMLSVPIVQMEILDGRAEITGNFTKAEAEELATMITMGSLPVSLKIVSFE